MTIVVKCRINVAGIADANESNEKVAFKHNVSFRSCISKINNTLIDDAKYLDIIMSMYNLLGYGENDHMTSGIIIENYHDAINEINPAGNYGINNYQITTSKCFEYKTKIIGNTPVDNNKLDAEVLILLNHLSNF